MKFIFFKFILIVTAALPLTTIHQLGTILGFFSWKSNGRIKRIAEKNIQLCFPELNTSQQEILLKKHLMKPEKLFWKQAKCGRATPPQLALIKECENQHLIDNALKQKRGVIIAMPHYGSWEMTSLYCASHYPMTTMYAPQPDMKIDQLIQQARQRTGATLVPTDNSGIRALSKALKQGEVISILPDQSPKTNGLFAPFFGHHCYTMTLLSKLASKNNACVIFTYAKRLDDDTGFKLVFREASKDLATLSLKDSVAEMNINIEKLIRETPHQYQWTYKRFKEQPDGAPSLYQEEAR